MTNTAGTHQYSYDLSGQLTGFTPPGAPATHYSYDAVGNRVSVTTENTPVAYATNALNQYTSAGGATFSYDVDGNMASRTEGDQIIAYEYDILSRLVIIRRNGTVIWECAYDALGNRIRVINAGVAREYVHDPIGFVNAVAEYNNNGNFVRRYVYGVVLAADQDATGRTRYYCLDALANTVALTTEAGAVVGRMTYAPFGSTTNSSGETATLGFIGGLGVVDDANGLLFMKNRYYMPAEGRFLQTDPIGISSGDVNPYRYCLNMPVSMVDPAGLKAEAKPCEEGEQEWKPFEPYNPQKGYCGGPNSEWVPEFSFNEACYNHDKCYHDQLGSKEACDDEFFVDMSQSGPLWLAYEYYKKVREHPEAQEGYDKARDRKKRGREPK